MKTPATKSTLRLERIWEVSLDAADLDQTGTFYQTELELASPLIWGVAQSDVSSNHSLS